MTLNKIRYKSTTDKHEKNLFISGDKDSRIADELVKLFKNIEYTAVEPNGNLVQDFDFSIVRDPKYKGKVKFNLLQDTEQNYRNKIQVCSGIIH